MKTALIKTNSSILRLLILGVIVILSFLIVSFLGVLAGIPIWGIDIIEKLTTESSLEDPSSLGLIKYMQLISHLALFIVPAFLYAFLVSPKISNYFDISAKFNVKSLLLGMASMLIVLPLINFIGEWNASMSLPESMSGLKNWIEASQESAKEYTVAFLNVKSIGALLFNIFLIAIIPAIGEELIFRGILLNEINKALKNSHIAVILSAVLFSAMHMEFFAFIPRLILGLMLGYLYVWSKNILIPILVHFFNNAVAVIVAYLHYNGHIQTDLEHFGSFNGNIIAILSSSILSVIVFYVIFLFEKQRTQKTKTI